MHEWIFPTVAIFMLRRTPSVDTVFFISAVVSFGSELLPIQTTQIQSIVILKREEKKINIISKAQTVFSTEKKKKKYT